MRFGRPALLCLLVLSACKSKVTEQGVLVTVKNPAGVVGITWLRVVVSNLKAHETLSYPVAAQATAIEFPTAFSVTVPSSRSGEVDLAIDALDATQAVAANAAAFALLQADAFVPTVASLSPGVALCGDGKLDSGETCDDGNRWSGDGCSYLCQAESGTDAAIGNGTDAHAPGGSGGVAGNDGSSGWGGAKGTGGTASADAATVDLGVPRADARDLPFASGGGGAMDAGGQGALPGTGGFAGSGGVVRTGGTSGGTGGSGGASGNGGTGGTPDAGTGRDAYFWVVVQDTEQRACTTNGPGADIDAVALWDLAAGTALGWGKLGTATYTANPAGNACENVDCSGGNCKYAYIGKTFDGRTLVSRTEGPRDALVQAVGDDYGYLSMNGGTLQIEIGDAVSGAGPARGLKSGDAIRVFEVDKTYVTSGSAPATCTCLPEHYTVAVQTQTGAVLALAPIRLADENTNTCAALTAVSAEGCGSTVFVVP